MRTYQNAAPLLSVELLFTRQLLDCYARLLEQAAARGAVSSKELEEHDRPAFQILIMSE